MSMFDTAIATCPNCGTEAALEVVLSVNADRRPDLRVEILEGTFQAVPCPKCGTQVRLEPEFIFFDLGRKQWIVVHPTDAVDGWAEAEQHARAIFDESFGAGAPPQVRELTEGIAPRIVFGWPALQEKLLCADLALDDATLELLKLAILRVDGSGLAVSAAHELRLAGGDAANLRLDLLHGPTEAPEKRLDLPRQAYDDIADDPAPWQALRAQIAGGLFVDMARMFRGASDDAPAAPA
jgi:endogenous inhibitor of DNA gyrase (YacG/DUF329 family)